MLSNTNSNQLINTTVTNGNATSPQLTAADSIQEVNYDKCFYSLYINQRPPMSTDGQRVYFRIRIGFITKLVNTYDEFALVYVVHTKTQKEEYVKKTKKLF